MQPEELDALLVEWILEFGPPNQAAWSSLTQAERNRGMEWWTAIVEKYGHDTAATRQIARHLFGEWK